MMKHQKPIVNQPKTKLTVQKEVMMAPLSQTKKKILPWNVKTILNLYIKSINRVKNRH